MKKGERYGEKRLLKKTKKKSCEKVKGERDGGSVTEIANQAKDINLSALY